MRKSVKAALFSALVLPGFGHFILRRWLRGLIFALPALGACTFLVLFSVDRAMEIFDGMLSGEIGVDEASVQAALTAPPTEEQALYLHVAKWLLLASWIGGITDSAILGHKLDVSPSAQANFLPKDR